MIRDAFDTIAGFVRLAILIARSGFKVRGAYWTWRRHTAFGAGPEPQGWARWKAVAEYARWLHRMRRMT